jgi:hypothetical protein
MTVINNMTEVHDCDDSTGWSVFNLSGTMGGLQDVTTASEDMTVNVEGTQCLAYDCDKESGGYEYNLASTTDLSDAHLYVWISVPTALGGLEDLVPSGGGQSGVFLTARDSSGNRGYWHVAGADTWGGEWKCFVAYLGDAPDTNSGTAPTMTSIDYVGLGVDHPNAKSKASCNIFFDYVQYSKPGSEGITVYGGSEGSELDLDHLVVSGEQTAMGVIRKYGGIYFVQGPIKFGHDTQDCYFKDTGKTIAWEDHTHISGEFYKFEIIEGASQTTQFDFGNKSGTQGIQGCTVLSPGGIDYLVNFSGETIEQVQLYGSTFQNFKSVIMSASGEREVLSCAFVDQTSGEVWPAGIDFQYNNIINPVHVGMILDDPDVPDISNVNFIACPVGVEFTQSGEYSWSNVKFTNCPVDVWNNSGGSITINASNGANPTNTSGENITINNTVRHYVTGVAQNSEVTYVSGEGDNAIVLYNVENIDAGGSTYYEYSYGGDFYVDILIMHLSYEPMLITVELSDTTQYLPITQVEDRVYANP